MANEGKQTNGDKWGDDISEERKPGRRKLTTTSGRDHSMESG
jgi:hypothetical protein